MVWFVYHIVTPLGTKRYLSQLMHHTICGYQNCRLHCIDSDMKALKAGYVAVHVSRVCKKIVIYGFYTRKDNTYCIHLLLAHK